MRILLSIISVTLITACNYKTYVIDLPPETSKIVNVKLIDSLGSVAITLPARYDTAFSWTDNSDCGKPCAQEKYRFQPKSLRVTKESGFLWLGEPKDSIERFTISHSGYFPFHEGFDSSNIFKIHQYRKKDMAQDPRSYKIKSDTVEKIGDRYFSIIVIDLYDTLTHTYSKKLLAATTIKSNSIQFNFELLTRQKNLMNDNFIENAKFYLRTLGLSRGR